MGLYNWINERLAIERIKQLALTKKVPVFYGTIWYYLGGVSLFLFAIQVSTGILLLLYYQPGAATAFESVKFIVTKVEFGWLIRELHSWSGNLFIFFVFLHMFTVFFAKAYRKPRELTWFTGMLLLVMGLGFGFSGYLLPWNKLAFFATKVGSDLASEIPLMGEFLVRLVRGGDEVTGATVTRFYGFHVGVLPLLFTILLVIHLAMVQSQGMSVPPEQETIPTEERKTMPFFPNFVLRDVLIWLIVLNIIALLAVFFPWELGSKADPLAPAPEGIRPEWYFLFMFQTFKKFPAYVLFMKGELVAILLFTIGGLVWFFAPFLDRKANRGQRSKFWTWLGILTIAYMVVMTAWGYF